MDGVGAACGWGTLGMEWLLGWAPVRGQCPERVNGASSCAHEGAVSKLEEVSLQHKGRGRGAILHRDFG
jgi:hypothetical protein